MRSSDAPGAGIPNVHDKTRLHFLDALRGLAAAYVVVYHMALMPQPHLVLPKWVEKFALMGGTGVTLFFIVSAFSLYYTMPLRMARARPMMSFFLHRFFRIAPLFYVMIVVSYFRDLQLFDVSHNFVEVLSVTLFVFNLVPLAQESFVWAGWTIGVEVVFYACFPLVYARVRDQGRAVALCFVTLLLWMGFQLALEYLTVPEEWKASYRQWSALRHFPVFASGIVLYFWFSSRFSGGGTSQEDRGWGDAAFLAGIFLYAALCQGWLPNLLGDLYYLQVVCYSLMFAGLALSPWRVIVNRFTSFLGKISYSLYLFHPTVVYLMIPVYRQVYTSLGGLTVSFLACLLLTFVVLLPLAYLGYRLIELPGMRLGKWAERRWIATKEF